MSLSTQALRLLTSRGGRIGTGATALGALTIFLWPSATWTFDIEKFVPLLAAVAAWLGSELGGKAEPHPNDVALLQKLLQTIGHDERLMMAEHDLGNSFPIKAFAGSNEVADTWKGPAFEFQDRELERRWVDVRGALKDFVNKVNLYTGPVPGSMTHATVKTGQDMATGQRSPLTLQRTKELNEAASVAVEKLDALERLARGKLRI